MYISRVQVDEGFLDSLDIEFVPGLNVLIGARGTGKTSLIELIRFGLGAKGFSADSSKRSHEHALSILGSGQVTITLVDEGRTVTVSRTANDDEPRATGQYRNPIIFSQTEVENLGLQPTGRVRLLDSFANDRRRIDELEIAAISEVQSVSIEIATARTEIDDIERQLTELSSINEQLAALGPREQQVSQLSSAAAGKKKALDELTAKISSHAVSLAADERLVQGLARWKTSINAAASAAIPVGLVPYISPSVVNGIGGVRAHIARALEDLVQIEQTVSESVHKSTLAKLSDEASARTLRKEIETIQAGAGAVVSAAQQLRERKAKLDALQVVVRSRRDQLDELIKRRNESQDRLDAARDRRYEARRQISSELSSSLGPRIKIGVNRAGQWDAYAGVLTDVLKGSGLRYNDLSMQIAESVSPRELLDIIERSDSNELATSALITGDRASRALAQLRSADLGRIATVLVDDDVSLQLLDGSDYKDVTTLSTGQRCTVILPLVLHHADRMLVIDQPEDHIDNAFIADTLIKAIVGRSGAGQLIFSTHNANIPVLGNAALVSQLGSDGRRGFVVNTGVLDDPAIVEAITSVMEGGIEAFRRRAEFYDQNDLVPFS
jgi:hypothetical protein